MKRRSLLTSVPIVLSGCLGFGTSDGSTDTQTTLSPSPTPTATPTEPRTPTSQRTPTPSEDLGFEPDGQVFSLGETVTVGPREFRATDRVLKREIRHLDRRTETITHTAPAGSASQWLQVSGRVSNIRESLVPAPSLDEFRVHYRGGRHPPTYRIDTVGDWSNLRESGVDDPIGPQGLDPRSTYIAPGDTVRFDVLFAVESGPAYYLEWDAPARPRPVIIRIDADT